MCSISDVTSTGCNDLINQIFSGDVLNVCNNLNKEKIGCCIDEAYALFPDTVEACESELTGEFCANSYSVLFGSMVADDQLTDDSTDATSYGDDDDDASYETDTPAVTSYEGDDDSESTPSSTEEEGDYDPSYETDPTVTSYDTPAVTSYEGDDDIQSTPSSTEEEGDDDASYETDTPAVTSYDETETETKTIVAETPRVTGSKTFFVTPGS